MTDAVFLDGLRASLFAGVKLVQLRAGQLSDTRYRALAAAALALCRAHGARLLLNADPETLAQVPADGVHLDGRRLRGLRERPLPASLWVSAACHSAADLERAHQLGVDFALASPVRATATHPGQLGIGWAGFRKLAEQAAMPLYALGGLRGEDILQAKNCGGQGIAAIRGLWKGSY